MHADALHCTAMLFQDAMPAGPHHLDLFVGIIAGCVLLQTCAIVTMAAGAAKGQKEVLKLAKDIHAKTVPVFELSRSLLEEVAPKMRVISDNVAETSFLLRDQAQKLDLAVKHTMDAVHNKVERVEEFVNATMDGVEDITKTVQHSVMVPVKQVAGMVNGLRAAIEKLTGSRTPRSVNGRDEDYFV